MTEITLLCLLAVAIYLVDRWEKMAEKEKGKASKLDWWEEKIS